MAKKLGKKEKQLVMVGPGAEDDEDENLPEGSDDRDEDEGDDEDEEDDDAGESKRTAKKKDEDDEDDSDEDDERVGHGEDDEEEDADGNKDDKKQIRESRKARRERQRKARARNELELSFLRSRNETLEKKLNEVAAKVDRSELGSIEQRLGSLQGQLKVADQVLAKAYEDGTGEDVVEAQNIRDRLKEGIGKLNQFKTEATRRSAEAAEQPEASPDLVFHAKRWMSENNWYNPNSKDADSRAVSNIDSRLAQEGYDPNSIEYWDELTSRAKRRLPHRFTSRSTEADDDIDDDQPKGKEKKSSGPKFSTGGRERPLRGNQVYVSPERKQALIDAGVWEDKTLRQKYLRRYAEYDRENPRGQRRSAR
jgi:hypothetical protein